MERIKIVDKNGNKGYILDFVFSDSKGVLAIVLRADGKIDTMPANNITIILKADK